MKLLCARFVKSILLMHDIYHVDKTAKLYKIGIVTKSYRQFNQPACRKTIVWMLAGENLLV